MKKTVTILLVAVILICNMFLIATAEPGVTEPANEPEAVETVQPTASPDTEPPATEQPDTEPPATEPSQTQEKPSDNGEGNIIVYTSMVLRSEEYQDNNDSDDDNDNSYDDNRGGAAVATDDESYSKTTRSIPTTAKPTTKAKKITDYGKKYAIAKWIAFALMILSAGGLILINTLNYKSKKEAERKRRARAAQAAKNAGNSRNISSHSNQDK